MNINTNTPAHDLAARIMAWLGSNGRENSASLLLYEAMQELKRVGTPAVAAPAAQTPAADLQGLRDALLAPREIVRDELGHFSHPQLPYCDEGTDTKKLMAAFGLQCKFVEMDGDAPADFVDAYFEGDNPDCSDWTPTPPAGDGWALVCIFDSEDGPYAMFVRPEPREQVSRQRAALPAQAVAPVPLLDHQIRELVNTLRDVALEFHGHDSLRSRIASVIAAARGTLDSLAAPVQDHEAVRAERDRLAHVLRQLADPAVTPSCGDPAVLRECARSAVAGLAAPVQAVAPSERLPSFDEIAEKKEAGQRLSALERLIYENDSADPEDSAGFLTTLVQVIDEVRAAALAAPQAGAHAPIPSNPGELQPAAPQAVPDAWVEVPDVQLPERPAPYRSEDKFGPDWFTGSQMLQYGRECAEAQRQLAADLLLPTQAAQDAARYRLVRRGQHWSVIDGIGGTLRAETLDAAVDTELSRTQEGAAS